MRRLMGAVLALCVSSATAGTITYVTTMTGPNEFPPNASPGIGTSTLIMDPDAHTMTITFEFSGLTGNTTAMHIHAPIPAPPANPTAGVATQQPTFAGSPLGVTAGNYSNTFDLSLASSWNPTFVTNNGGTPATAEAAFLQFLADGRAYLNIHSSTFPGGEIRGFYVVPEPSSLALLGLAGLALIRRR